VVDLLLPRGEQRCRASIRRTIGGDVREAKRLPNPSKALPDACCTREKVTAEVTGRRRAILSMSGTSVRFEPMYLIIRG
jgi:hypothetical protein